MLNDRLLKNGWRVFVIVLYIVMIGSIVIRLFSITDKVRNALNILQVSAAVAFIVFAWFYYKRPWLVRNGEVE